MTCWSISPVISANDTSAMATSATVMAAIVPFRYHFPVRVTNASKTPAATIPM